MVSTLLHNAHKNLSWSPVHSIYNHCDGC